MKRTLTFLLVLVSLVSIIGYSHVSAKEKTVDYPFKGTSAINDFMYNTNDKYEVVVKKASSYKKLTHEREYLKSWYTDDHYYQNFYTSADKTLTVQLQLVSTKTGKAVKNSKVKYYAYNDYDKVNPDCITRDGKYTYSTDDMVYMVYAVYKKKIYRVSMGLDEKAIKEQEKIDSDPFKYAPEADQADHWYLVPKGYKWADNRCGTVINTKHKDGTVDEKVYIFPAVFVYDGQKIEWVIKNYDTGEEISVNKAQKQTDVCYESFESTLKVKKDGKTIKYNKLGTDKTKEDSGLYAASVLRVYYDGMIYSTYVIVLPTKADAEWCENHADFLSDPFFGTEVYLYAYLKYKGIPTDAWDW